MAYNFEQDMRNSRRKKMITRLLELPYDESFFLFGPRGVGKTTLLKQLPFFANALYINLLKQSEEQRFSKNPDELISIVALLPQNITHIIIDEVQKIPKLLIKQLFFCKFSLTSKFVN